MNAEERRMHRRLPLQLPIVRLSEGSSSVEADGVRTRDVSAGGMYFSAAGQYAPTNGAKLEFEIDLPPGEGYSTTPCKVRGSGTVVRRIDLDEGLSGVAVRFTKPLSFEL